MSAGRLERSSLEQMAFELYGKTYSGLDDDELRELVAERKRLRRLRAMGLEPTAGHVVQDAHPAPRLPDHREPGLDLVGDPMPADGVPLDGVQECGARRVGVVEDHQISFAHSTDKRKKVR